MPFSTLRWLLWVIDGSHMRSQTSMRSLQAELDMLTFWHFAFEINLTNGLTLRPVADLQ